MIESDCKMIISKDEIKTFVPKKKPSLVFLGTMGAINARTIDEQKPEKPFFYNDNRNHFWKIIQLLFEPQLEPKKLSVKEKMAFLNKWQIAICNIVQEIKVEKNVARDPSDFVLFEAHRHGCLKFKRTTKEFDAILNSTPIFFTCRPKKEIRSLIDSYLNFNNLDSSLSEKIWYLATPTRCNPQARSIMWKKEIEDHIKNCGVNKRSYIK